MRPDFSPLMLALFLRVRAAHRAGLEGCSREVAARRTKAEMRRVAKVTVNQVDLAWMGRLLSPAPRAAIWAALGHFPSLEDLAAATPSPSRPRAEARGSTPLPRCAGARKGVAPC
jgi:hypothetical protein